MANNKIELGDEVLIDLTQDTVTEDTLLEGETAHDASGNPIVGRATSGTGDYEALENKPQINNVELSGNKSLADLGIDIPNVVDTFQSTSTTDALSANRGRLLEYSKATKATSLSGYGIKDAYTKTEVDDLLDDKADVDSVYTTEEVDEKTLIFKGTHVEWNALPQSEKNKYDSKEVIFTDDYNSNICSSVAECVASTSENDVAGASAVKELNDELSKKIIVSDVLTYSISFSTGTVGTRCVSADISLRKQGYIVIGIILENNSNSNDYSVNMYSNSSGNGQIKCYRASGNAVTNGYVQYRVVYLKH